MGRKKILQKFYRCFKCLKKGHKSNYCRANITCKKCSGSHNLALCDGGKAAGKIGGSAASPMHVGNAGELVAMQTAQALVRGESESRVRVLFDSGSNKSFVT